MRVPHGTSATDQAELDEMLLKVGCDHPPLRTGWINDAERGWADELVITHPAMTSEALAVALRTMVASMAIKVMPPHP